MTSADITTAAALTTSPKTDRELLTAGLRTLAGLDMDRAHKANGVGFSRYDSDFGHKMATLRYPMSARQVIASAKLVKKYHKQLAADVIAAARTLADMAPEDIGATTVATVPARNVETEALNEMVAAEVAAPVRETCRRCCGTGRFITGTHNGVPTGPGGDCFRCGGKGYQTAKDDRRNDYYDRHFAGSRM